MSSLILKCHCEFGVWVQLNHVHRHLHCRGSLCCWVRNIFRLHHHPISEFLPPHGWGILWVVSIITSDAFQQQNLHDDAVLKCTIFGIWNAGGLAGLSRSIYREMIGRSFCCQAAISCKPNNYICNLESRPQRTWYIASFAAVVLTYKGFHQLADAPGGPRYRQITLTIQPFPHMKEIRYCISWPRRQTMRLLQNCQFIWIQKLNAGPLGTPKEAITTKSEG